MTSQQINNQNRIDLQVEIPEELMASMSQYLDSHPGWSQHRIFSAALSLFLMQNRGEDKPSDRGVNQVYLDMMFDYEH